MKSLLEKILSEEGKFVCQSKFLTPRKVKDILSEKFNVRVIDMSSSYIKLQIVRFTRFYGAPVIWFDATIEIEFRDANGELSYGELLYKFFWPDYLMLLFTFLAFLLEPEHISFSIFFWFAGFLLFGTLFHIDTRLVKRQVRKLLENA